MSTEKKEYQFPKPGSTRLVHPPVIVGSGPAGLFCAWYLAKAGYRPLVLELSAVWGVAVILDGHHRAASAVSTILASNGEMIPPCGVFSSEKAAQELFLTES